VEAGMQ